MESVLNDEARARLVRLCAKITGDAAVAEDLAQETLLEAWRNSHKLHDPSGADRWLAAIARNVCRRHARARGRDLAQAVLDEAEMPGVLDLDIALEREELVELLDRALALLPRSARDVLVGHYVEHTPHAELASRLGISPDAVSMRISRGRLLLRRLLAGDLRAEAAAYGLVASTVEWRPTRIWCVWCGGAKLEMRRTADAISFRCSRCAPGAVSSEVPLRDPFFAGLIRTVERPSAIIGRLHDAVLRYFSDGAGTGTCPRCGSAVRVHAIERTDLSRACRGLHARCDACGSESWSSMDGIAAAQPAVRAFRRSHPRLRHIPRPDPVLRYEDIGGTAVIDVAFYRETLRIREISTH